MSHVFHRHLHHTPPVAVAASGLEIRDAQGRSYIDASGGAAVSSLGHGHPDVIGGALKDHCHGTNPRLASADDYEQMLATSL